MAIGPVQLIVLGFEHPEFHGEIIAELERLKENDTVRVIDALAVHKDADGEIEVRAPEQPLQGRGHRARQQGRRADRPRHRGRGGHVRRRRGRRRGGGRRRQRVLRRGGVGRHRGHPERLRRRADPARAPWAVPLRDAIARAGGFRISDGFISPLDLVAIGLVSREEAQSCTTSRPAARPRSQLTDHEEPQMFASRRVARRTSRRVAAGAERRDPSGSVPAPRRFDATMRG